MNGPKAHKKPSEGARGYEAVKHSMFPNTKKECLFICVVRIGSRTVGPRRPNFGTGHPLARQVVAELSALKRPCTSWRPIEGLKGSLDPLRGRESQLKKSC